MKIILSAVETKLADAWQRFCGDLDCVEIHCDSIFELSCDIPFLISAPTMRVPMILKDSVNPYLAARAVFLLIKHGTFASTLTKANA